MNCTKIGNLIRTLRQAQNMTQKQLADKLNVSDKAVSKWERGCGLPDVSLLPELADILQTNIEKILNGDTSVSDEAGGNMKRSKFYVCPECGNISVCTGEAEVSCCGRKLEAITPVKADEDQKLSVEVVENDWYISSSHPMNKDDYIMLVAFVTGDRLQLVKQYPEWDLSLRMEKRGHGMLMWYSDKEKFLYQLI